MEQNPVRRRCGDPMFDAMIWRHIRDQGGWHTRREIGNDLALNANQRMQLAHTLRRLEAGGHIVQRPSRQGQELFGVTARCLPLVGESLMPDAVTDC
jgi:hypothetical protein